jgi:hypothetical protein
LPPQRDRQRQDEAESNRLRAASISPQIEWQKPAVTDRSITRWNGAVPQVQAGGNIPGMLLNVTPPQKNSAANQVLALLPTPVQTEPPGAQSPIALI